MKVLEHSLTNIYQHRSRTVSLTGAVIGVVGAIGAGKSTLIGSIGENIIGDWSRKVSRVITLGEKEGEATTRLNVRPGLDLTITRNLKDKTASLKYSDSRPPVDGADAVNAAILAELGVDKSILREVVFVKQDEINNLLFALDSTKDRLAAKFFGIDRSVAIEKDLSSRINALVPTSLPKSSSDLYQEKQSILKSLAEWTGKLEQVGPIPKGEVATLQSHLAAYLASDKLRQAQQEYVGTKTRLEGDISTLEASTEQVRALVASIPIEVIRQRHIAETEKNQNWNRREALKNLIKQLNRQPRPACPHDKAKLDELRAEIERIKTSVSVGDSVLKQRREMLGRIKMQLLATCETCGEHPSKVSRMQELVDQAEQNRSEKARLHELELEWTTAAIELRDWEQKEHTFKSRLQEAEEELASIPDEGPGDPEKWERNITSYDNMRETLAREQRELQKRQKTLAELVPPQGQELPYPEGFDAHQAQTRVVELQEQQESLEEINREILLGKREAELLQVQLDHALKVEKENEIQAQLRAALVRIRARFHPDGAPKELIGQRIERMEVKINEYLSLLESKFKVRACGGFNFEALFEGKTGPIKAAELSGGEKISLSLAFRLAAVETFSASVGLLVLDEPTNMLDVATIEHFKRVLARLRTMAEQLNMQFVVITHSQELIGSFDQLIEL